MTDEYVEIYPEARDRNLISVGVDGIAGLVDPTLPNYYNFWAGHKAYVFLGAVSGAFFGIFAVLLCWHLMTSMLAVQRIKIGILRSLGAGEKDVIKIVLLFAFILSVFTFLLSLAFTLAGYYGFLYPAFYTPKWGVSEFFFTGWTVLILAGLSFGVPILCSLVPLRKFLKKSISRRGSLLEAPVFTAVIYARRPRGCAGGGRVFAFSAAPLLFEVDALGLLVFGFFPDALFLHQKIDGRRRFIGLPVSSIGLPARFVGLFAPSLLLGRGFFGLFLGRVLLLFGGRSLVLRRAFHCPPAEKGEPSRMHRAKADEKEHEHP